MVQIRVAENFLAKKKRDGLIIGPVHLGVGQEAIPVGISAHTNSMIISLVATKSWSYSFH